MRNILIAKNYQIQNHTAWHTDRSTETNLAHNYTQMAELMTASASRYLADLDEIIISTGEQPDIRTAFKHHYAVIQQLWESEPVNILYADLDVLFLKPTRIFGTTEHFCMFNLTDPPSTTDAHYGVNIPYYFNCGIRYYPASMSKAVWDLGAELIDNWNPDRWDAEQIVYNIQMWSQGIQPEQVYKPELAYQVLSADPADQYSERFNQIPFSQAQVVHVHGSRGSSNRLALMQSLAGADKYQHEPNPLRDQTGAAT